MITNAIEILKKGGIIALPTETVYGLAVDMTNENAIKKLYELKKRNANKSFAIAISGIDALRKIVKKIPEKALILIKYFWPGPLTLVLEAGDNVPSYLISNGKIGIRNPKNKTTLDIIKKLGNPVALTSANISGKQSCKSGDEVKEVFGRQIDMVVENREKILGVESTVVDITDSEPKILREGYISKYEIAVCLHRK